LLGLAPSLLEVLFTALSELPDAGDLRPDIRPTDALLDGVAAECEVGFGTFSDRGQCAAVEEVIELVPPRGRHLPRLAETNLGDLFPLLLRFREFGEAFERLERIAFVSLAPDLTRNRLTAVPLVLAVHRAGEPQQASQVVRVVAADPGSHALHDILHQLRLGTERRAAARN